MQRKNQNVQMPSTKALRTVSTWMTENLHKHMESKNVTFADCDGIDVFKKRKRRIWYFSRKNVIC